MPKQHASFILKSLTLAISSSLLFACSSTKSPTTTPTKTLAVNNKTTSKTSEYVGVLDQATLDELEDLLFATDMTMVEGDTLTVQRYGNLWDRVRRGYRMSNISNSRIEAQKSWFYSRQDYLNRLTARTSRYLHHTVTEAERRGIPTELALLPIIESSYDPSATSNAAAAGLWQFIPSTGRIYGLNQSSTYDGRRDIIESTRAAYDFLTSLYNQFGSWELALAAYNAGPGRVQRAISANRSAGLPTDYWSLRLPKETMDYVPRFMAVAQIVRAPSDYGVYLPAIANHTHFRTVPANYGVTLYEISGVTGVPIDELRLLNPALINYTVDSAGPGRIVIPNSLPTSMDVKLTALRGQGFGATSYTASSYVVPKSGSQVIGQNSSSANELALANTLPTTSAQITPNNTIIQEPPLSNEEREFIAAQIRANTAEPIQPISNDGNIDLSAIQTSQSVLEARGETKSLSFNTVSTMPTSNDANTSTMTSSTSQPTSAKSKTQAPTNTTSSERYKVVAGDTLTGIAAKHGLTVKQLASYNDISTNTQVKTGERLWLVPNKVSTVNTAKPEPVAKTTMHTVIAGESLTSIARKYNTTVADVAALNGLAITDGVRINQKLKVPDLQSSGAKAVSSTKVATQASKSTTTQSIRYTVRSGDSLYSVAAKYGVSRDELAAINNMDKDAGLIQGKIILIPTKDNVTTDTKASTSHTAKGSMIAHTENYKVQAGDSLNALAKKYGVSTADLATTNHLSTNAQLKRGQTIKVPKLTTTYTVKSGDTLISLAKHYGISTAELANMNNLNPKAGLKKGQKLTVPNK